MTKREHTALTRDVTMTLASRLRELGHPFTVAELAAGRALIGVPYRERVGTILRRDFREVPKYVTLYRHEAEVLVSERDFAVAFGRYRVTARRIDIPAVAAYVADCIARTDAERAGVSAPPDRRPQEYGLSAEYRSLERPPRRR